MTWLRDGQSVRYGPGDYAPGSVQQAVAQSSLASTVAQGAAPTFLQVISGDTAYSRRYNERIENAWRDPEPTNWKGGGQ